jgi:hypothetical protein
MSTRPMVLAAAPDVAPMTLLNPLAFAPGSLAATCAATLARVDAFAHILFWAEGTASLGDEVALALIELTRLGLSFALKRKGGDDAPRLWCCEHSGWYVSWARPPRHFAAGARHVLMLTNAAGDTELLVPNCDVKRVRVTDAPLCVETLAYPETTDAGAPYFLIPIHSSDRFLKVCDDALASQLHDFHPLPPPPGAAARTGCGVHEAPSAAHRRARLCGRSRIDRQPLRTARALQGGW